MIVVINHHDHDHDENNDDNDVETRHPAARSTWMWQDQFDHRTRWTPRPRHFKPQVVMISVDLARSQIMKTKLLWQICLWLWGVCGWYTNMVDLCIIQITIDHPSQFGRPWHDRRSLASSSSRPAPQHHPSPWGHWRCLHQQVQLSHHSYFLLLVPTKN